MLYGCYCCVVVCLEVTPKDSAGKELHPTYLSPVALFCPITANSRIAMKRAAPVCPHSPLHVSMDIHVTYLT